MLCMYNHTDCEENSSQIYSNAFMQNRTQKGGNGRSHTLIVLLLLSAVLPREVTDCMTTHAIILTDSMSLLQKVKNTTGSPENYAQ